MGIYTRSSSSTTERSTQTRTKTNDTYAKAAVGDAFRGRDLSLAREPDFQDRAPGAQPRHLGEVVEEVTAATARKAIQYWMKEATLAVTEAERTEALEIAGKVAKAAGLAWPKEWGEAA